MRWQRGRAPSLASSESPQQLLRRDCRISPNHLHKNRSRGDLSSARSSRTPCSKCGCELRNRDTGVRGRKIRVLQANSGQRPSDNVGGIGGELGSCHPSELGFGGGAADRLERAPAFEERKKTRRHLRVLGVKLERDIGKEFVALSIPPVELRRVSRP